MEKLTKEQIELLRSPLPPEAVQKHPTKTYLSTIKAPYVIERFNDVFGEYGWKIADEKITEKVVKTKDGEAIMVVLKVYFKAEEYGIERWSYGGNDNPDLGDAYKGAVTDALTKIGMTIGVGMDVYKGLATPQNAPQATKVPDVMSPDFAAHFAAKEPISERVCGGCGKKFTPKLGYEKLCYPCYKKSDSYRAEKHMDKMEDQAMKYGEPKEQPPHPADFPF